MQEMQEMQFQSLGQEDPMEKEMAAHSSIFTKHIPYTAEPDGLQFMGFYRVRHDWAHMHKVPNLEKSHERMPRDISREGKRWIKKF